MPPNKLVVHRVDPFSSGALPRYDSVRRTDKVNTIRDLMTGPRAADRTALIYARNDYSVVCSCTRPEEPRAHPRSICETGDADDRDRFRCRIAAKEMLNCAPMPFYKSRCNSRTPD